MPNFSSCIQISEKRTPFLLKEDLIDGLSSAFSCIEPTCSAGGKIGGCLPPPNSITFESSESGSITPVHFFVLKYNRKGENHGVQFRIGQRHTS